MSRTDTSPDYFKDRKKPLVHRLLTLVRTEGAIGTLWSIRRWVLYKAHYRLCDRKFERHEAAPTSRNVRAADLDFDADLRRHSVEYLAAPRLLVHRAIRSVPEPLERFTFIDIGSGLGRPLLVAAEYPFKDMIGYELSPSLHKGAVENIERATRELHLRRRATSVNANALEADWPGGSRVFFLFNPFDREFMERFLRRVQETATPGTRHYLLMLNLKHPELLECFPFQRCPASLVGGAIWRTISPYPLMVYRYELPAPGNASQL